MAKIYDFHHLRSSTTRRDKNHSILSQKSSQGKAKGKKKFGERVGKSIVGDKNKMITEEEMSFKYQEDEDLTEMDEGLED